VALFQCEGARKVCNTQTYIRIEIKSFFIVVNGYESVILHPFNQMELRMLEIAGEEIQTLSMDHHGLVASVCKDLKIAERIDKRLGVDEQRVVSPGQAVVAMILNGLGFTNRRLYLTHQFFETKPVSRLLDANIKAEDITDYTLGHTLDEIWEYGSSKLFGEVAFETALENNLLGSMNHLDTTSAKMMRNLH
jgi:Domain of unknown function (DUF4277)